MSVGIVYRSRPTQLLEMNRAMELWAALELVPNDMPLHDGAEVAAIAQLMDECETEEQLSELGGRLRKTQLHELDSAALRWVYKDCLRMIRIEVTNAK